ncbi:MAG: DUF5702 domain-containing protein [Lachnospiraceae bacterium]
MENEKKKQGSITVFLSLMLVVYLGFYFVLLESARLYGLEWAAQEQTNVGVDSVMAEWSREVYESYDLYLLDTGYGSAQSQLGIAEQNFLNYANKTVDRIAGMDFFQVETTSAQIVEIQSALDAEVFQNAILESMQENSWLGQINFWMKHQTIFDVETEYQTKLDEAEDIYQQDSQLWEGIDFDNLDHVDDFEDSNNSEYLDDFQGEYHLEVEEENTDIQNVIRLMPMKMINVESDSAEQISWLAERVLRLMIPENVVLSEATIMKESLPSELLQDSYDRSFSMQDKIEQFAFLNQYICDKFTCFTDSLSSEEEKLDKSEGLDESKELSKENIQPEEQKGIAYQIEYILYGKDSDKANLSAVVNRLLILRTALNLFSIQSSATRVNEAKALAATVTIFFPVLAPAYEAVVLLIETGWACGEAVVDISDLLKGEKVPIHKKESEWKLTLSDALKTVIGKGLKEEKTEKTEESEGMSYKEYLTLLLCLYNSDELTLHIMDVIQNQVRCTVPAFYIQNCIFSISIESESTAVPRFCQFMRTENYSWKKSASYQYYQSIKK